MRRHDIIINPPVRGYWAVYNPPGHPILAFDLLAVDEKKSLYNKGNFIRYLFSLMPNKPRVSEGFGAFGGNYIMVRSGDFFVLLCHLKKDSAKVKIGDLVRAGQQLGEVGNSGSSIQPHLHIQVMNSDQYFPLFANLLPFKFSSGKMKQGKLWSVHEDFELTNKMHYSFG